MPGGVGCGGVGGQEDPFELFISATKIRFCYYAETHKILGNTFGMCVLQVGAVCVLDV